MSSADDRIATTAAADPQPLSSDRWESALFAPADIASLVFVRVAFGAILIAHVLELFGSGAIDVVYGPSRFHFHYLGFQWVSPWPGDGMAWHFAALGLLAGGILCGLFYRVSATAFCLGFAYVFLIDRTAYYNHYYLIILLSAILAVVPAHRSVSFDVLRRPALYSPVVPAWTVWLLRFQIGIVYVYSGVAKLESDWLFHQQPVRLILGRETNTPLLGPLLGDESIIALFTYGGIAFDLLIVPLLLWRRTRELAFVSAVGFHVINAMLFDIGILPWLMIAMTTIFLDPGWPRHIRQRLFRTAKRPETLPSAELTGSTHRKSVMILLGVYVLIQLLIPIRHRLYPGQPNWTEEGQNFSWRLMHRFKAASDVVFVATSAKSGQSWHIVPAEELSEKQLIRMSGHPDLILEFSHFLADQLRAAGYTDIQIRALTSVALNGRPPQSLIDPQVNLAAQSRSYGHQPWILPLDPL